MELAKTEDAQDDCGGDLEEGFFLSEQDKARGLSLFGVFIERLTLARNPCGFWARTFRRDRCTVEGMK